MVEERRLKEQLNFQGHRWTRRRTRCLCGAFSLQFLPAHTQGSNVLRRVEDFKRCTDSRLDSRSHGQNPPFLSLLYLRFSVFSCSHHVYRSGHLPSFSISMYIIQVGRFSVLSRGDFVSVIWQPWAHMHFKWQDHHHLIYLCRFMTNNVALSQINKSWDTEMICNLKDRHDQI